MSYPLRNDKTDIMTFVLHWMLVITLFYSLSTGLRIAADARYAGWARNLSAILPQGDVLRWHVWAAYILTLVVAGYVIFLFRARLKSRVALDGMRIIGLIAPERISRWRAINVILYWLAFVLVSIAALTGTFIFLLPGLLPYQLVSLVHQSAAWLLLLYTVLHVLGQLALGGLRQLGKVFQPRLAYAAAALTTLGLMLGIGAGVYAVNELTIRDLPVAATDTPPRFDGDTLDVAWLDAPAIDIVTLHGGNQPGGEVTVTVRMLHDKKNLYALFEWPDPTRSQKHLPLQKTGDGWRVLQKDYRQRDENDYYEDQFAVMLAHSSKLAGAGTAHLGPRPLAGKPAPKGGRGLHYTVDDSIVDVWHWQSVRSAAVNQADDSHIGPAQPQDVVQTRYTGGFSHDPDDGGGFRMNWRQYSDAQVQPLRLPKHPMLLERLGRFDPDPEVSDDGEFWLALNDTVAYNETLDTAYPVGTVLPSVLIEQPFRGDRGDIGAAARWRDGWWRLQLNRKLITDSPYDVALHPDEPVYLWVAVFDHTLTRHSFHLHPLRIVLE